MNMLTFLRRCGGLIHIVCERVPTNVRSLRAVDLRRAVVVVVSPAYHREGGRAGDVDVACAMKHRRHRIIPDVWALDGSPFEPEDVGRGRIKYPNKWLKAVLTLTGDR